MRSLRYYELQEMLRSERTSGGQRVYDVDAVERVALIRLLFRAGVPSSGVVELLPCIYSGTTTPAMVDRLLDERARIDAQAQGLLATRDRLDGVIAETRARVVASTDRS